jgi:hypothetical protein
MSPFNTAKTTVLAPMAKASVKTAAMANPGDLRNWRKAKRRSCSRVLMVGLWATTWQQGKKGNSQAKVPRMQLYEDEAAWGI